MDKCNFCNHKKAVGCIVGGLEKKDNSSPNNGLYRYAVCQKCFDLMKPFIFLPLHKICKSDIFEEGL